LQFFLGHVGLVIAVGGNNAIVGSGRFVNNIVYFTGVFRPALANHQMLFPSVINYYTKGSLLWEVREANNPPDGGVFQGKICYNLDID
jgi:hypothetical protein